MVVYGRPLLYLCQRGNSGPLAWKGERVRTKSTSGSYCSASVVVDDSGRRLRADLQPRSAAGSEQTQQTGGTSPKQAVQAVDIDFVRAPFVPWLSRERGG